MNEWMIERWIERKQTEGNNEIVLSAIVCCSYDRIICLWISAIFVIPFRIPVAEHENIFYNFDVRFAVLQHLNVAAVVVVFDNLHLFGLTTHEWEKLNCYYYNMFSFRKGRNMFFHFVQTKIRVRARRAGYNVFDFVYLEWWSEQTI